MRELDIARSQRVNLGRHILDVTFVIATGIEAMPQHRDIGVKPVIGQRHLRRVLLPECLLFDLIPVTADIGSDSLGKIIRRGGESRAGCWRFNQRRDIQHILKMALADQRGVIPGRPQQIDKGHIFMIKRHAERAHAMA